MKAKENKNKPVEQATAFELIPLDTIILSSTNYRKDINAKELAAFADEIKIHGIISPVTVRPINNGRYELVAGERRLRAAKLAGLYAIPAVIKHLTDEQVLEIQLAENIQRENPHPLEEARAIGRLLELRQSMEEIAARLGKSKQYIYLRIKLLSLIASFQELFLANQLTLMDALKIAALDEQGQQYVSENTITESGKGIVFDNDDLDHYINRCKFDLTTAPFNIKDKKLIPEKGACTACPFNSATLKSLFPEMAKEARCNNGSCYEQKCQTQFRINFSTALYEHQPEGLIFYDRSNWADELIASIPQAISLPHFKYHNVETLDTPEAPDQQDYIDDDGVVDDESWETATREYEEELMQFESDTLSGVFKKGLLVSKSKIDLLWYNPDTEQQPMTSNKVTSLKVVQEEFKNGTATVELLQDAITLLYKKEDRAVDLDREKVQLKIHEAFSEKMQQQDFFPSLTAEDRDAAKLLIYSSLSYQGRSKADELLHIDQEGGDYDTVFDHLKCMDDTGFARLIRLAVLDRSESKLPQQDMSVALYDLVVATGIDWQSLEDEQNEIATKRRSRMEEKINALEKKISEMQEKIKENV